MSFRRTLKEVEAKKASYLLPHPRFFVQKKSTGCKQARMEDGMMVDELGTLFVLLFCVVLILSYASFSRMVQMRLAIDNVCKEYLYQMEQSGTLSTQMQADMKSELQAIGVDAASISFAGTSHLGTNQAKYGDKITLKCSVQFDNPLYRTFGRQKSNWFKLLGVPPKISYSKQTQATSRW